MRHLKVQWFPGHMAKARRMIEENFKLVDVVLEMLDARAPYASSNPLLLAAIGQKPKVLVLNKADLADPKVTAAWLDFFAGEQLPAVQLDANKGKGIKNLLSAIKEAARPVTQKWRERGVKNRPVRLMVAGIPNVGKSSLIKRLAGGQAKIAIADKPGVTRGKQWISTPGGFEMLDTPGMLWPKFEDPDAAFSLAVSGAIKDDIFDIEEAVLLLLEYLKESYPDVFPERYSLRGQLGSAGVLLESIALKRGCLQSGGLPDKEKASRLILKEFRSGLLGRISLDIVNELEK